MNVTIRERTAVYIPDYTPDNPAWKIQLQDAHRLVTVAGIECFVKRFERLLPAWNFLVANRGRRHVGLPLIYDAQSRLENGRTVYYLFLERIEGELLHDVIRTGGTAKGPELGRSMAAAFKVLREQGYWHADFCTKNIMVTTASKQFVLIDLDSLEPVSTFPSTARNQPGYLPDQELAVYAFNYVKTYVQPALKSLSFFPGIALNVIQLIFLLDKIVYFAVVLKPQGAKFGQKKNFENLPAIVHRHLGAYTSTLVKNVLAAKAVTDEMLLSQGSNFQTQLQSIPHPVIPPTPIPKVPLSPKSASAATTPATVKPPVLSPVAPVRPVAPPAVNINFLQASKTVLKTGEATTLSWASSGAAKASLTYFASVAASGTLILTYEQLANLSGKQEGRVELVLSLGTQGPTKSVFIELKAAWFINHSSNQLPPQVNKPVTPVVTKYLTSSSVNSPTTSTTSAPVNNNIYLLALIAAAITSILIYQGGFFSNKESKSVFIPNQQRGLELFDEGKYDSSFVHLINFKEDTNYNFATQFNLAYMYDFGQGTVTDDTLAVNLYRECLRSKTPVLVSNALYYLGMSYLLGEGCQQDVSMAKKYFIIAANDYNNKEARNELQKLRNTEEKTIEEHSPVIESNISEEGVSDDIEAIAFEPIIRSRSASAESIIVKRFVQFSNFTRVDFIYNATPGNGMHILLNSPGHPNALYIIFEGLQYKLLKTSGISSRDRKTYAYAGKPLYFSAFFEKIPSSTTKVDIIEGESGDWDFYGVELNFEAQ